MNRLKTHDVDCGSQASPDEHYNRRNKTLNRDLTIQEIRAVTRRFNDFCREWLRHEKDAPDLSSHPSRIGSASVTDGLNGHIGLWGPGFTVAFRYATRSRTKGASPLRIEEILEAKVFFKFSDLDFRSWVEAEAPLNPIHPALA